VFELKSSGGHPFILFVIPKQRTRRILAKATVNSDDPKPKLLLREGDLWTKGFSTGKRLARTEDWDEIYEEVIEAEAELRARARTAHMVELAVAREKVKPTGHSSLPSVFNDEEFQALMDDLCARRDEATLQVRLESLRDEVVEGWNSFGAFEHFIPTTPDDVPEAQEKVRDYVTNVLRPSMIWLTLAGLYTIKNSAPALFLDAIVDLLREVFETAHLLQKGTPRFVAAVRSGCRGGLFASRLRLWQQRPVCSAKFHSNGHSSRESRRHEAHDTNLRHGPIESRRRRGEKSQHPSSGAWSRGCVAKKASL